MTTTNHDSPLCPGCFAAPATAAPCATCGFDPSSPRPLNALPAGLVLNRQFLIGRVLGHPGGFGITYLAFDQRLHKRVAIKEYLPRDLAARAADSTRIQPYSTEDSSLYQHGLQQFEREARILAQLDHPNIVRVMQFFEAHGSAYLVMDYYSGETLAEYLNRQPNGRMQEADALRLIQPILDGLRAVHAKQLLHRDIKPANLYLARSSAGVRPILIDFGAARHAVGERSRSPTEAEWEYAARAGTTTAYWWGDQASREYANYGKDDCCGGFAQGRDRWEHTAPVGSFPANAFGLHDMNGNVWEWVFDVYASYTGDAKTDPVVKQGGSFRVVRGGSWDYSPHGLRSAGRDHDTPSSNNDGLGFRLARTL